MGSPFITSNVPLSQPPQNAPTPDQPPIDPQVIAQMQQQQADAQQQQANAALNNPQANAVGQAAQNQAYQNMPQDPNTPVKNTGTQLVEYMKNQIFANAQSLSPVAPPKPGFRSGFQGGVDATLGMKNPFEQQLAAQANNRGNLNQLSDANNQLATQEWQRNMVAVPGPNGQMMMVPGVFAAKMLGQSVTGQFGMAKTAANNDTKMQLAGYNPDGSVKPLSQLSVPSQVKVQATQALQRLNSARTDAVNADPNTPAGQAALGKLRVMEQNAHANLSRAASAAGMERIAADKFAADYVNGMQDEDGNPIGVQQYKAANGVDKAPAAMLQQAEYAQGGLEQFRDARAAIKTLREHGVLSGVPANKMEEMLFGNGLIDPSLSPEDQKLVGTARSGLGLGATAALRAHTGRGSREIYQDFKQRFGVNQGNEALDAALDQGEKLLSGYAAGGSNRAVHALRHPGAGAGAPKVGDVKTFPNGKSGKWDGTGWVAQ